MKNRVLFALLGLLLGAGSASAAGCSNGTNCFAVWQDCLNQGHTTKFCIRVYNTCQDTCGYP